MDKLLKTDCENLKESSLYIKRWIDGQPEVKEESISDWLLFDMSQKIRRIVSKSFTRHEEAKLTGADWEWWILYSNVAYKFRVQAKKVLKNNFSSLNYTNKHGRQIDKLIQDARQKNFFPLYIFYTNSATKVKCSSNIIDEGAYIVSADELHQDFVIPQKNPLDKDDILERSIPLSCLLCCPLVRGGDLEEFIHRYFLNNTANYKDSLLGRYENTPRYVTQLLEYKNSELPEWWESEYRQGLDGIKSITIFDLREKDNND